MEATCRAGGTKLGIVLAYIGHWVWHCAGIYWALGLALCWRICAGPSLALCWHILGTGLQIEVLLSEERRVRKKVHLAASKQLHKIPWKLCRSSLCEASKETILTEATLLRESEVWH